MDVSIVIVNWNTRSLLLECLQSVSEATDGLSCKITVVDNGSSDGSSAAVKSQFPRAKLIENKRNLGFATANNQALRLSQASYALLLNSDARISRGALRELIEFMKTTPDAGIAAGQYVNELGKRENSIDNFPTLATELLNKSVLRILLPGKFPSKRQVFQEPREVESVIGACMIVRMQAVRDVGLLDEDYFFFLEETDWCYRMRKGGWKVYHLPHVSVVHLKGKSKRIDPARAWVEYYRSSYLFFKKNRGSLTYVLLRMCRVAKLMVNLALTALGLAVTLGYRSRLREKVRVYGFLFLWHLRGCSPSVGLRELD
jgi:GT2 family glycosyltransferase